MSQPGQRTESHGTRLGRYNLIDGKTQPGLRINSVCSCLLSRSADTVGDEAAWAEDRLIGRNAPGAYAHHCEASLAIGYVPTETLANGAADAKWEIEILGERRPAMLQLEPLFDPKAERMRG